MQVTLLTHTNNPEQLVASAAHLCNSEDGYVDLEAGQSEELLKNLLKWNHTSPLEHASFTFLVEGVSRALTHQLVRHRIGCSYTQQSQRYTKATDYVLPPSLECRQDCQDIMEFIYNVYEKLCEVVPKEDARYFLPNAAETKIVVTMNARSLLHLFELREDKHAQWEIRELAYRMRELVAEVMPTIFKKETPEGA